MQALQSFPVFEADQVLSNAHLNNLLNYLEQQERLSRMKLIGSGIVCGLKVLSSPSSISVSKGCALSSQGYIVELCDSTFTHYVNYAPKGLPNSLYFIDHCKEIAREEVPFYAQQGLLELVLADDKQTTGKKGLNTISLEKYALVLFLEASEVKLKNCDTRDCNDKGSRMDFRTLALLVPTERLPKQSTSGLSDIPLRRYNVPFQNLKTPDDILQAFLNITDDETLHSLNRALHFTWQRYADILDLPSRSGFDGLNLVQMRNRFEASADGKLYSQYFYDFVDDLLKAFSEFCALAEESHLAGIVESMSHPMHVMLGLASVDTLPGRQNTYRNHFVPAPHISKTEELKALLLRLQSMTIAYRGFAISGHKNIVITPDKIGSASLGERAIPYYYSRPKVVHHWSYKHFLKGTQEHLLGYHKPEQSGIPKQVQEPLLFDLEAYNFFRVEGHLGQDYRKVLKELLTQQEQYNLPIDIIAIQATHLSDILNRKPIKCHIQDLEAAYSVLVTGILCQMKLVLAYVSDIRPQSNTTPSLAAEKPIRTDFFISKNLKTIIQGTKVSTPITKAETQKRILLSVAPPATEERLLDFVSADMTNFLVNKKDLFLHVLRRPELLLLFLDQLSNLILHLAERPLTSFDEQAYMKIYDQYAKLVQQLMTESEQSGSAEIREFFSPKNLALLFSCTNEQLFALVDEYKERLKAFETAVNFQHYFKTHPGLEHKSGVPKGGTLVLVYNGKPPGPNAAGTPANTNSTAFDMVGFQNALKDLKMFEMEEVSFERTISIVEKLAPADERERLVAAIKEQRGSSRESTLQLPDDIVIADFYLPYLCKSSCPPVAYVFETITTGSPKPPQEEPKEPEPEKPTPEPEKPSPEPEKPKPVVSLSRNEFCSNDKTLYPIKVQPAGGVLTLNGVTRTNMQLNPSTLNPGNQVLKYAIGSEVSAFDFKVFKAATASILLTDFHFSTSVGWTISLAPTESGVQGIWYINNKVLSGSTFNKQVFKAGSNPALVELKILNQSPCENGYDSRQFIFEEMMVLFCPEMQQLKVKLPNEIPVELPKSAQQISSIKISAHSIAINLALFMQQLPNLTPIPLVQMAGEKWLFTSLRLRLLVADFIVHVKHSIFTITGRGNVEVLSFELMPDILHQQSHWTLHGKKTEVKFDVSVEEVVKLKELPFVHTILTPDGKCKAERKLNIESKELLDRIKRDGGKTSYRA